MKSTSAGIKTIFYLPALFLLILSSCSRNNHTVDDGYYFENFDNLKMWTHDVRVTDERAHSGSYSAYTDSLSDYSATFEMDLSFARSKGYRSLNIIFRFKTPGAYVQTPVSF